MVRYSASRCQILLSVLIVAVLLCAACAPTPAAGPSSGGTAKTKKLLVGFTISQTGKLAVESARQTNGLQLWMKHANDAGGVKLPDGTTVTFEAKSYDDESNKDRVTELYGKLINEDKVDVLISPYSSGLADAAAAVAQQNGKILITAGAASDSTYQKGYSLVFQTYTPGSQYLTGAINMLISLDPQAGKIAIVHENEAFSTGVCTALRTYAERAGYQTVLFESYESGTTDFTQLVDKTLAAGPAVIMGGGHYADTSAFAQQLRDKGVKAKLVALLVAPAEPKFADLGDAAFGVLGPSQWEPVARYRAEAAQALGQEWYGPSVADFTSAYQAAYGDAPSYHSAGGYAAGLILQKAIEKAGSYDTAKLKTALDSLDMMTFFGGVKFDVSAANHGLQVGHEMVYIQWQRDASNNLVKQVIWPPTSKSADVLYPMP